MRRMLPILFACLVSRVWAQPEATDDPYRNFPLIISLQFHGLHMPFRDVGSNFSNVGVGVGTELSLNRSHTMVQQVSAVWYRNRALGNGILLHTQAAWRPTVVDKFYAEVKAGAGYLYAFRPVESFRQENGQWVSVGHKGKGLLTIPMGLSVGYNGSFHGTYVSPYISYQFLAVTGYNPGMPLVPETLIQIGSRIHLK